MLNVKKNKPIQFSTLSKKLGNFVKVENMASKNGYGTAPNQFILYFKNGTLFQSYQSYVAAFVNGQLYVNEHYHTCSNTTAFYCKKYTELTAGQRKTGINNGTIKLFES